MKKNKVLLVLLLIAACLAFWPRLGAVEATVESNRPREVIVPPPAATRQPILLAQANRGAVRASAMAEARADRTVARASAVAENSEVKVIIKQGNQVIKEHTRGEIVPGSKVEMTFDVPETEVPVCPPPVTYEKGISEEMARRYEEEIQALRAQARELEAQLNALRSQAASSGAIASGQAETGTGREAVPGYVAGVATTPPIEAEQGRAYTDKLDININYTRFESRGDDDDNDDSNGSKVSGEAWSARARYRFYTVNENLGAGLGAHGLLVDGESESGRGRGRDRNDIGKRLWSAGPTLKSYGDHSDTNYDFFFGKISADGASNSPTVFNPFIWHTDWSNWAQGKSFLPKWEAGLGSVIPIANQGDEDDRSVISNSGPGSVNSGPGSANSGRGRGRGDEGPRDFNSGEIFFKPWLYGWQIGQHGHVFIGADLGAGFEKEGEDSTFFRYGLALETGYNGQKVLEVSAGLKNASNTDKDLTLIGASLSPTGLYRAYRQSQYKTPDPEDLVYKKPVKK